MPIVRHSKKRDAMLELMRGTKCHPTADWVYQGMKEIFPDISLGTVYRNLTLLADIGEIQRLRLGDGVDHFDADISPHYHFVCSECGKVIDLAMDSIDGITDVAAKNFGGEIKGHMTYFYGSCDQCSKRAMQM